MDKIQTKKTGLMTAGLFLAATGMFTYQNFFMPAQQEQNTTVVYIAANDIPTDAILTQEMLTPVSVSQASVVPGSVTNVNQAIGKRLIGGILKGEQLFEQRISSEIEQEGTLYVKVEPDYPVDLRDGEHVVVLVQKEGSIDTLFERKQIYASSRISNLVAGESSSGFYLLLTPTELEDYYLSKANGQVIMSKIHTLATSEDTQLDGSNNSSGSNNDTNTNENGGKETTETDSSSTPSAGSTTNLRYEVKAGDTMDSIAYDLQITVDQLRSLNDGKKEVEPGDMLIIPN